MSDIPDRALDTARGTEPDILAPLQQSRSPWARFEQPIGFLCLGLLGAIFIAWSVALAWGIWSALAWISR